ncbi:ABC transporter substrate-binding protein [Paenibacillus yonginensis]|uniref:ABC transporter substrate-binding protein n=1 Tax=Paenibacillus yonginensis TaxID=1462996 RepID=A0A1B1MVT8_9BACL|nr:extracellular solute-binding protein [Paenibacillus yonginensis]ANS73257.1 ABC transporter substrate-binding protein [Paenibacillus yonginensis]
MKRKKKGLALLTGLLVISMALSGCGSGNSNGKNNSAAGEASTGANTAASEPGDPFGAYNPPVTLSAVKMLSEEVKFPEGQDIEHNVWSDLYKQMGIDVKYKWTVTGSDQYDSKLNIAIASKDLPDFMMVNETQLRQLADAGQLADLTEAFNNYASDDLKAVMKIDENALPSATFDGKLLAIPSTQPVIGGSAPLLWVRADWMKKLGLQAPTTMDDVVKMAEAFAANDPDGNGKADTYGLGLTQKIGQSTDSIGIFNGYGAYPQIWVDDGSGGLQYGSIQPEMKEALATLQKMYAEKLIDPEFGVKDTVKMFETITSNKLGMVVGPSWYPAWPFWDMVKADPSVDWVSYPMPSVKGGEATVQMPFSVSQYYVLKKGYSHPELIVKLANLYYQKLYSDEAEFDKYGQVTTATDSIGVNKYSLVEVVNPNKDLIRQQELEEALKSKSDAGISSSETKIMFKEFKTYLDGTNPAGWSGYAANGPDGAMKQLRILNDAGKVISNGFVGAPTETMAEKKVTLDKLEIETFTKIITGEASLDSFDSFVKSWKSLGGDQITKEVNEWKTSH